MPAILKAGGQCLITADHGNAEQMFNEQTQQPHTAHTSEPVPLICVASEKMLAHENGVLSDVAPTLLDMMEQPVPTEMTGKVLFKTA